MNSGGASVPFFLGSDHVLHRVQRGALIVGVVGLLTVVLGAWANHVQFFRSYLVAYLFWTGIVLGSLAILMLQHVTGGAWGAVIRRSLESATRTLPLMLILFVPLIFGLPEIYEWADPEKVAHDALLQHKRPYLNVPFFIARATGYFGIWLVLAWYLNRWSSEQDTTLGPRPAQRLELLSRGGLVLYGLTMTFAAIDWVMSLEPHWFSTIYGILFIGGQILTAFAFVIPITVLVADRPPLSTVISADRFQDLGKLLLAFVMIWAYLAFSQFLIIWSADLPEETPWYANRLHGGWGWLGMAIIIFHFAVPFVLLLSRNLKRQGRLLALVAVTVLGMRMVDTFWLVGPAFFPRGLSVHWQDLSSIVAVGGIWLALFLTQLQRRPLLPLRDPSLPLAPAE